MKTLKKNNLIFYIPFISLISIPIVSNTFELNLFTLKIISFLLQLIIFLVFVYKIKENLFYYFVILVIFNGLTNIYFFQKFLLTIFIISLNFYFLYCYLNFEYFETKILNNTLTHKLITIFERLNMLKKIDLIFYILIFSFLIISQNKYLNFETIDWDIHTYLVSARDVNSNLPLSTQWESKPPLFFYIVNLLMSLSNGNFIIFKLLNDLVLFIPTLLIYFTVRKKTESSSLSTASALLFLMLLSNTWSNVGYSEIYVLVFLSVSFYLNNNFNSNISSFNIGFTLALASLVNIGSLIFVIGMIISTIYNNFTNNNYLYKLTYMALGLFIPHALFFSIYYMDDLTGLYISTLITMPLAYTETEFNFMNEFFVFLRSLFEYNLGLFLLLCISGYFSISVLFSKIRKLDIFKLDFNLNIFIFCSIGFYYLAAKGYYHHLLFMLFFISMSFYQVNKKWVSSYFQLLTFAIFFVILFTSFGKSLNNLIDLDSTYENYPLRQLSKEIDLMFDDDFTVLAFDNILILYYLDKENYSYIVHPTNHYEKFITNDLIRLGLISENQIENMINENPDILICSEREIYLCENPEYKKIDTKKYEINPNLHFYEKNKQIQIFKRN